MNQHLRVETYCLFATTSCNFTGTVGKKGERLGRSEGGPVSNHICIKVNVGKGAMLPFLFKVL